MAAPAVQSSAIPGRRRHTRAEAPADTVVAYLRVSTDEQAQSGAGLDAQRAAISAEADRQGWTITAWHCDEGLSGGLAPAKRPGLAAALATARSREAAVLVAAKLDRISRSMADATTLLRRSIREGWQLVTCDMAMDTSTPQGRAAAHMLMTFAELERDLIGQRTREALAVRKAAGVQLGTPTQVPDDVLRRIITEAAEGRSLRKIAADLMADGTRTGSGKSTWHPAQVKRALDCQHAQKLAAEMFRSVPLALANHPFCRVEKGRSMANSDLEQTPIRLAFEAQGDGHWTTVYDEISTGKISGGAYCALADPANRDKALSVDGWFAVKSSGGPGFSKSYPDGEEVTTYFPRTDSEEPFELLVLVREFHGAATTTIELDQQFRLFHNLLYVSSSNSYVKMNDDGTRTPAVRFIGERVEVRTALLKEYIAARQMDLLLFADFIAYSSDKPKELGATHFSNTTYSGRLDQFELGFASTGKYGSRYCATKVIPPGPVEACGIWPYEDTDDNYPEFIIGENGDGKPVKHTCNPEVLADYFGGNPEAPHYLTPVHFRRDVLAKYYNDPQMYSVEDGYLRCASLWGLQVDNDHDDRVVVFLGDLGRDLPSAERDHWRGHMITPDASISSTNFHRSFLSQPVDPAAIDLIFRRVYNDANRAWEARYGWSIFREPKQSDIYLLQQLRMPLNDTEHEFEEAIKLLGKLLSDALNESSIGKALPDKVADQKGISKLERFFILEGYPHTVRDIQYLRRVQELRSKVSAHLKGQDYDKVLTKNLGEERGAKAVQQLLGEGVAFMRGLIAWVAPGQ